MIECLECGHDEAEHSQGRGPVWPCLVPGCRCHDVACERTDDTPRSEMSGDSRDAG